MESGPVLSTHAEQEAADELLAALSDIAYASPEVELIKKSGKHKSKFFFQLDPSFSQATRLRAKTFKKKKIAHIDDHIIKRLKAYRKEVPDLLEPNITKVREFFLKEIAPRTLAGGPGMLQARDVVQRLLNTEIDGTQFDKFERMSHAAVSMVMAKFVAHYYGLPIDAATKILIDIAPRQPSFIPVPVRDNHESVNKKDKKKDSS